MPKAVIVGGGIASLLASSLLADQGFDVEIVERNPRIGGLLNSTRNAAGDWFDYGTHFIAGTDNPAINDIVLPERATSQWQHFANEKAGNFFAGRYSENCLFVDTRALPDERYRRAVEDYLATTADPHTVADLDAQLRHRFGDGCTDAVFAPALGKLFGVRSLTELTVDAHLRFGMKRIKMFSPEQTRELKAASPHHDDRLCYHEFSEGTAARPQYYPRTGGAGEWIAVLEEEADRRGVRWRLGATIADVTAAAGRIVDVTTTDGDTAACDLLVWTVPLFPLLRALDIRAEGGPPTLRSTTLFHYVFDTPPNPSDHFFFCYDPDYLTFRATLYTNLQPEQAEATGRHRVTVETLTTGSLDIEATLDTVQAELIEMGAVPASAQRLVAHGEEVREGFPVLDHGFAAAKAAQMEAVTGRYDNLVLAGRSCTDAWFMHEVFTDVWAKLGADVPALS